MTTGLCGFCYKPVMANARCNCPGWKEAEKMVEEEVAAKRGALATQEGGNHYKDMKIQPIEFIHANGFDFITGCIIKYAARHRAKNGAEDVRKIIHYCELLLELEYGEGK